MTTRVTRHYVTVGNRLVHYRRAGSGPPVVVLHQSPMSSLWVMPHIERFAAHFTVIAPDTPGNGESDPLPGAVPEIGAYAEALGELLNALKLDRAALFGDHTGACIVAEFARRNPGRVRIAVVEGIVMLPEDERRDLLANYTPKLERKWDGSHFVWAWFRLREQNMFFPWYRHSAAARRFRDVKTPAVLHEEFVQLLAAGDHYRNPYDAAFRFKGEQVLAEVAAPTHVIVMAFDPITAYLNELGDLPPNVHLERFNHDREPMWARSIALLGAAAEGAAPATTQAEAIRGRLVPDLIDIGGAQMAVRRNDDVAGRPIVLVHDVLQSARCADRLARALVGRRPVLAVDLPSHGDSDAGDASVAAWAKAVDRVLAAHGISRADLVGLGQGGAVVAEMAAKFTARVQSVTLIDPWPVDGVERVALAENLMPDLAPRWDGGHVLTAWHAARNQGIFWPWYRQTAATMLRGHPDVDEEAVEERALALFKVREPASVLAAVLGYPLEGRLTELSVSVRVAAAANGLHVERARSLAAAAGKPFYELPDAMADWAGQLLVFTGSG
jgi:pimeloyl-ACP methyl ester carboxylesterase